MAYLQLADNGYSHLAQRPNEYYIFIPKGFRNAAKDSYIREDLFDNLSPYDYAEIMEELAPYQNTGLSDKASRKADRAAKKGAKADKKELQGGGARRAARAERQDQRQQAKIAKKAAGGGAGGFLDKVIGGAKDIFGKNDSIDIQAGGGGGIRVDYDPGAEPTFFEKYKVPLIIGGVVVVAGGIYLVTKKKKR
jgi:hypothetical protein